MDLSKDTSVPNIIGTNNYLLVAFNWIVKNLPETERRKLD